MQNACNQNKYMIGRFTDFDLLTIHHQINGVYVLIEEFPAKDIPMIKKKYKSIAGIIKGIERMEAGIIFDEKEKALAAGTVKTPNIQSPTA